MKKYIIYLVILGVVIFGGYKLVNKPVEYTQVEPEVVEKEVTVEVETLNKRITDALAENEMNIEAEAYKMYLDTRDQLEKEVELEVRRKYRAELEEAESQLEQEVSL